MACSFRFEIMPSLVFSCDHILFSVKVTQNLLCAKWFKLFDTCRLRAKLSNHFAPPNILILIVYVWVA